MNTIHFYLSPFQIARLKLTFWYTIISAIFLLICSFSAIKAEQQAFTTLERALGNPVLRPRLTLLLDNRISVFEDSFRNQLFIFDGILLVIATGLSYLLSGRTLAPIQRMMQKQEDFAADASHELRTPLTTIHMEMEALIRTEKNIPRQYHDVFQSIQQEVIRMSGIVDGLLTLVRPVSYNTRKTWKIFDLHKLVNDCYKQMEPLATKKNIEFTIDAKEQISLLGSQERIKQVILILLDNAIKYTPKSGKIVLRVTHNKTTAFCSVSDTGVGINDEDKTHIFERFYRAKQQVNKEKGTGLGLAIAKKIVESNNGKISVRSNIEQGSIFTVELPIRS